MSTKNSFYNENDIKNNEKHVSLAQDSLHKTDVERRQTLGHPRSINPNMINHVPQQSPLIL